MSQNMHFKHMGHCAMKDHITDGEVCHMSSLCCIVWDLASVHH